MLFGFNVIIPHARTIKIDIMYFQVITENNLQDPQFPELLSLLCELRNLKIDGVKIRLGR